MLQFISGFVLGLLFAASAGWLFYRKFISGIDSEKSCGRGANSQQLEELSKLTGGLAHEIKNPLSTIKVNLKLISEDACASEGVSARWLKKIAVVQKETDRVSQILDDFLRYIGRFELTAEPVDVNLLIGDMIDFYSPQAGSHGITIRPGLSADAIICNTDSDMVKQVILNLFINAQQAMPDGGELIIRTSTLKKNAIIEISDTGSGISPQNLDRIFQAYYTSKPAGSGLGLSTAKKIINAHNGTINVNSLPGKGTSFTINLPMCGEQDL